MYDLIILGGGPAGYTAALEARKLDKKVLLIESDKLGGTCLNYGCIPTKSLLHSSKIYKKSHNFIKLGVEVDKSTFNLHKANEWKNSSIQKLRANLTSLLNSKDVEMIQGRGVINDNLDVVVDGKIYEGENILIATGSSPTIPNITGIDSKYVKTSKEILELETLPSSIIIIGGGVIGIEFASYFSNVGVEVILLESERSILKNLERRVRTILEKSMNITFYTGCNIVNILENSVTCEIDGSNRVFETEIILVATGRSPNSKEFDILGIVENGAIAVNEHMRSNIPKIYSAGDVTGKTFLAHSSTKMAEVAVKNMFMENSVMDFNLIPNIIYTEPEIAYIGLTSEMAKEINIEIKKSVIHLKSNGRYLIEDGYKDGIAIIYSDKESSRILGAHFIGTGVSEIITIATIAIRDGYTVSKLKEVIYPHPSITEILNDIQ